MQKIIIIILLISATAQAKEDYITIAETEKINKDYEKAKLQKTILDDLETKNQLIEETRNRVQALKDKLAETERQRQEALDNYNSRKMTASENFSQKLVERKERVAAFKKQALLDERNCENQECKNEVVKNHNAQVAIENENLNQINKDYDVEKQEIQKEFSVKKKELDIEIEKNSASYFTGGI